MSLELAVRTSYRRATPGLPTGIDIATILDCIPLTSARDSML
jgi:hypothetical protein